MDIHFLILLKLLFAHLLADFCFQPKSVVGKKKEGRQFYHILHASVHAITAYLVVGCWRAWYIPLIIGISHYIIDLWKSRNKESLKNFLIDQFLHVLVLIMVWLVATEQFSIAGYKINEIFDNPNFWIYITGFLFILKPTSIILAVSTKKWEEGRSDNGLEDAGQWIGYLERILVLIFMCMHVYPAIGFVLAAKSIYRFGELKEATDIRKTEYMMIGTFLSFTIAIAVGLIIGYLT